MQYQHKSLVDLIDGLSEEQIRRNIIPGKWSIFENIVHLQTYQHVFFDRINKIISGDDPSFPAYFAESDPLFLDNCHRSIREIMQDFISIRKEMATRTQDILDNHAEKRGIHASYGSMNLAEWYNFFLLHEAHHLYTILRLAATLKKEARNL